MNQFPVAEIFGPTIQGEGIHIGKRTNFIRFAGCDTHCPWCDTKSAWEIKDHMYMTEHQIIETVTLTKAPIVTLTGGNPVLYDLDNLCELLFLNFDEVHVETQGTLWKDWLYQATFVSVSPKPHHLMTGVLDKITSYLHDRCQLKVVLFSEKDIPFLRQIFFKYRHVPIIAQYGWPNKNGRQWLAEYVAREKEFNKNVRVLPQLHRIYWGDREGV